MDSHSPSVPLLFAFFIFLFMVFKKRWGNRPHDPVPNLPPGPWKLPIIGNMHQLLGPLPHHTLRDLAEKHGPLMHLKLGELSVIVASSPKFAMEIMKTHDLNFADRPQILPAKIIAYGCLNITFSPYGQYWRQLRKICMQELLSARRVESFQLIREEEVSNLIRSISSAAADTPINLTQMLFLWSNDIISRLVFGKRLKNQEQFISTLRKNMKLAGGLSIVDLFPSSRLLEVISGLRFQFQRARREFDEIFDDIIKDHRQRSRYTENSEAGGDDADFVDFLLGMQKDGDPEFPITDENVKATILDLFIGGTESTSTVLEWVMSELMINPTVMEKAKAEVQQVFSKKTKLDWRELNELKYLKLILKETLRIHPPGPLLVPRECRESCTIAGYDIPVKARVLINAWAISRDPLYWDNPESFKPERFDENSIDYKGSNFEFLPFGAGRRICPGITFAEANLLLVLAHLLYYFDWKLPNGMKPQNLDMNEEFGLTVHRRSELYLVPVHRFPLPN